MNRVIKNTTKTVPSRLVVDENDESDDDDITSPRLQFALDIKRAGERDPISTRNIDGIDAQLARRRLQPLVRPWGLPNRLPTTQPPGEVVERPANVPELTVKRTDSAAAINGACVLRGIPLGGNKRDRHAQCVAWEAQFGRAPDPRPSDLQHLPFYRVKASMSKDEANSWVDFVRGELVLRFGANRNKIHVVDYQGYEGTFKKNELVKETEDPFRFGEVDLYWLNRDAA